MEIQRLLTIGGKEKVPGGNLIEVGHASKNAIDLGLNVMWSDCNYGSGTMLNIGSYFAWGELTTKNRYRSEDYSDVEMDELDEAHDVIAATWGKPWRMPTQAEIQELVSNCEKEWKELDGIQGILFKRNERSIFFPVCGYIEDRDMKSSAEMWIWSRTQEDTDEAKSLRVYKNVDSIEIENDANQYKYRGLNVRPVCPANVPVTSVEISPQTLDMTVGESKTISCYVSPEYASNKNVDWTTTVSGIVSISTTNNECIVTALNEGTVVITATSLADHTKSGHCTVTVTAAPSPDIPVTSVSISPMAMNLIVGGEDVFTATITPQNATNKNVIWTSSNTNVATVNSQGLIQGISAGDAEIKVTTVDGGFWDICEVIVTAAPSPVIPVTGVSISPAILNLNVGEEDVISATITPQNATNKNVIWTSNDTNVATVNSQGLVKGISAGSTEIKVTTDDGGFQSICEVTVSESPSS